jgi:hypothetical protein
MKLLSLEKKCKSGNCKSCVCQWNNCTKRDDGTWIDNVTEIEFGVHETYENSKEGGFLTSADVWPRSQRSMIPQFTEKGNVVTPEGTYTEIGQVDRYRDKKILIIGAGPSTELLTDEDVDAVDYVWSCNHFFKHSKVKELKLDLVSIGNEVNLDKSMTWFRENPQTLAMMNFTISRNQNASKFAMKHPTFAYASRWFGRIGEVPRMAAMAALWAAKEIHIIGMDGHAPEVLKSKKSDSVFQPNKHLKLSSYDYNYQRRQFVVWCDYMKTTFPGTKLVNLGSRHEDNLWKFIGEWS